MSTESARSKGWGLAVIRDVAVAIREAHVAGVAHRALSPAVVHVDPDPAELHSVVARVGGWDRASPVTNLTGSTRLTTGGAPGFTAPEVVGGEITSWQMVDLWCLGKLAGRVWQMLDGEVGPMPARLSKVIDTLTAPDPDDREDSSALELADVASAELERHLAPVEEPADQRPMVDLVPGGRVGERYAVVDVLGSGATGTVVAVDDLLAKKRFAVKVFAEGLNREVATNEFSQLLGVNHPNVVRVRDLFVEEDQICLKMELLSGRTLRDHLDEHGPVDPLEVLGWADALLDALETLHGTPERPGIIHRDLKPSNLIVEARGLVVIDFGLASSGENVTVGGSGRYRPALAPADALDPSVDLFAVAVIIHEAMTGIHPFGGNSTCEGSSVIDGSITGHLRDALEQVLDPDRDRRFHTAAQFRRALRDPGAADESGPESVPDVGPDPEAPETDIEPIAGSPLGPKITLEVLPGTEERVEAQTLDGVADVPALITSAVIRSGPNIRLDVEFCEADNGERWIRAVDAYSSPACIHRLVHGLRTGIRLTPDLDDAVSMDLRQAKIIDDPDWPRQRKVSLADLDEGAAIDVSALLVDLGAKGVGTRESLWGDSSRARTDLCVLFDPENLVVAFAAYALIRLAPLVEVPPELADRMLPEPVDPPPTTAGPSWPSLDTSMSEGRGGLGDRYLPSRGYWVCHERNLWRIPRMPFSTLRTALFGKSGAQAICAGRGPVADRTAKWGAARLVVVRVGDVALLTDGGEVALIPWEQVPPKDAAAAIRAFENGTERRPLDESAFD